jgi:hypothetical protein
MRAYFRIVYIDRSAAIFEVPDDDCIGQNM